MSNRWFRFVIALLAIGAAGAAGYRVFQQEQTLTRDVLSTREAEQHAETALVTTSDLKAALHAYVAAGQGPDYWTARTAGLLATLRASLVALDGAASGIDASFAGALDQSDRVAASEQRARDYVRTGQALLAGEVIFTEMPGVFDELRASVVRARDGIRGAADARHAAIRREEIMLALGAAGVLAFAVLLLVIPARPATVEFAVTTGVDTDTSEYRVARAATVAPTAPVPVVAPQAPAPPAPVASVGSLAAAAAVCTDLGRVSQSLEISALLDRAAKVLTASGIIVWMASDNRDELFPVASSGYDERIFTRIRSIQRSSSNLTASAFREAAPRTSVALGTSAAALAVPLLTPQGSVGVFSAELRDMPEVDSPRLAIATIFAAQLSTLLGSMAAPSTDARPAPAAEAAPPAQAQA